MYLQYVLQLFSNFEHKKNDKLQGHKCFENCDKRDFFHK